MASVSSFAFSMAPLFFYTAYKRFKHAREADLAAQILENIREDDALEESAAEP